MSGSSAYKSQIEWAKEVKDLEAANELLSSIVDDACEIIKMLEDRNTKEVTK